MKSVRQLRKEARAKAAMGLQTDPWTPRRDEVADEQHEAEENALAEQMRRDAAVSASRPGVKLRPSRSQTMREARERRAAALDAVTDSFAPPAVAPPATTAQVEQPVRRPILMASPAMMEVVPTSTSAEGKLINAYMQAGLTRAQAKARAKTEMERIADDREREVVRKQPRRRNIDL